jgi:hypothetical protein
MKRNFRGLQARSTLGVAACLAGAGLAMAPTLAQAESGFATATSGTLTATARLDFRVVIPRILFLQVGTGTLNANNTTVDLIDFTVGASGLGTGTAVTSANTVTARVISSVGAINLSASTVGALSNGSQSISYSQIAGTASVLTSATALAHPALGDGVSNSVSVPATNGVVNRDATWTFSYSNAAVVPAGTYGGVNTNNSRVTYTATSP